MFWWNSSVLCFVLLSVWRMLLYTTIIIYYIIYCIYYILHIYTYIYLLYIILYSSSVPLSQSFLVYSLPTYLLPLQSSSLSFHSSPILLSFFSSVPHHSSYLPNFILYVSVFVKNNIYFLYSFIFISGFRLGFELMGILLGVCVGKVFRQKLWGVWVGILFMFMNSDPACFIGVDGWGVMCLIRG